MEKKYDLAVLGGGPGGYVAAIRAAKLGLSTVLVERAEVGGTCLNRGCIPTKSLLHSAGIYQMVLRAGDFGVQAGPPSFDYAAIAARKDAVVQQLRGGVEGLLKSAGVEVLRAAGSLLGPGKIRAGEQVIEAGRVILATGSVPAVPPVPGADLPGVLTSDGVLQLDQCPTSVVIVGGGVIGVEFAALYRDLGVSVTVVEMMDAILTGMDRDVSAFALEALRRRGVKIHLQAKVLEIRKGAPLSVVFEEDGAECSAQGAIVLLATGRKALLEGSGAVEAGIQTQRGVIAADSFQRTNLPGVYAVGDCAGTQLAHAASAQGVVAAHHAAGQTPGAAGGHIVPACVYTSPEIACVGLTEEAAGETGRPVKTGSFPVAASGKCMVMGEMGGFCKLVTDGETGEILGAHIVAPHATDMIGEIAAIMRSEGTADELADTIHPHPTVSEILMEAAHDVEGLCSHKP